MATVNAQDNARSAVAIYNRMRITPRKLGLVADLIRNQDVSTAVMQLTFSKKPIAREVKKCLNSAIANAEYNHQLDIDNLKVSEVKVGKALVMKRMMPRARGRGASIHKYFSNLTIIVKEKE